MIVLFRTLCVFLDEVGCIIAPHPNRASRPRQWIDQSDQLAYAAGVLATVLSSARGGAPARRKRGEPVPVGCGCARSGRPTHARRDERLTATSVACPQPPLGGPRRRLLRVSAA